MDLIPQVDPTILPKLGLQFKSWEEAREYYNMYAKNAGFSTCIQNSKKDKQTDEVVWKMFTCSKEGTTSDSTSESNRRKKWTASESSWKRQGSEGTTTESNRKRQRTTNESNQNNHTDKSSGQRSKRRRGRIRCGCEARMSVSKVGDVWEVGYFIENHNHVLATPRKVHFLRSHRCVSATKRALAEEFSEANIPTCQQVRLFEIDSGVPSMMGCLEKDIRNKEKARKKALNGHDAQTLLHQFEMEKERDENFYYVYETDDKGVFIRCFWADSESRNSYASFGSGVVFDTTYKTNKCGMVFAPFVGVNHHRQTTLFGCGLLSDEKTESFIWLFSTFLDTMTNQPHREVIITDQDAAISLAVAEVFWNTMHRYCIWHILNKFSEKLGPVLHSMHYQSLFWVINDSESSDEFEYRWTSLIDESQLSGNEWLSKLYNIRDRWVPTFVKGVFAAGMSSSQRVESNHSFFKRYVSKKCSLNAFFTFFGRALAHQRREELMACHIDLNEKPRINTLFAMERQMCEIYTRTVFLLFQEEFEESASYTCKILSNSNDCRIYEVRRFSVETTFQRKRLLTYDVLGDRITCSCKHFEFEGYPCRHMLCWMRVEQVMLLPEMYIEQRWTKTAKSNPKYDTPPNFVDMNSVQGRRGALMLAARALVDAASLTEERSKLMMERLRDLMLEIENIGEEECTMNQLSRSQSRDEVFVCDPQPVATKGKRIRSGKEKGMSQNGWTCGFCHKGGHDKRTCPDFSKLNESMKLNHSSCL